MQNQQQMTNKWREVRQKLKEKWNQLSDQDLRSFDGNVEHLIGQIQRKTGESRAAIEHFLDEFMDTLNEEGSEMASQIRETAQQGYEAVRDTYAEAERAVQRRPAQAVAVAFGLGMVAGLGVVFLLRERQHESTVSRAGAATERLGRQILDRLASMVPTR